MNTSSYTIHNVTRQSTIGNNLQLAKTAYARRVGLLYHQHLEINEGILIPARSWLPLIAIHTIGMKFSIDVIFVDSYERALEICTLPPNRVKCVLGAWWVLETAEGTITASRTQKGDQIDFTKNS